MTDTRLVGDYRLLRTLGRGGSAVVHLAEDLALSRPVALKVLVGELSTDAADTERFVREAKVAASLDHPHIVPIYAAGQDDGRYYIAMRYVPGPNLGEHLREHGRLPLDEALRLLGQVASALDAAHRSGVVHRDVKPGNILLEAAGDGHKAFLTDFGIARALRAADARPTTSLGTLAYSAPEVFDGSEVGVAADVYAFACVAYECLTGVRARQGTSHAATIDSHLSDGPVSASSLVGELPPAVDAVLTQALRREPSDRPSGPLEVVRALEAACRLPEVGRDGRPSRAPRPRAAADPALDATVHRRRPAAAAPDAPSRTRRGRSLTAAAALAALILTAGSVALVAGRDGSGRGPSAATSPVPIQTSEPVGRPSEVARGLRVPWGITALPDGSALVSERDTAEVKRVDPDGRVTTLGTVPGVTAGGQGGLLGIALSPSFAADASIYAFVTSGSDNRIVRVTVTGGRIGATLPVLTGIPKAEQSNGGRLAFGPDGMLYVGTGDVADPALAQDTSSLAGKVLRVRPDGGVPADNPFAGSPVFSMGHQNVQGLAFDDQGRLWATELGRRHDEVNLIRPGGNYGWPVVEGPSMDDRYVPPVASWTPRDAGPSGAAVAGGALWVAALGGQRLWQVPIDGTPVPPRPWFVGEFGNLRAVEAMPGGALWVLTNEPDARVIRVALSS